MNQGEQVNQRLLGQITDFSQVLLSHWGESRDRPRTEPHECAAIHQGREHSTPNPELITNWTHTQDNMELTLQLCYVKLVLLFLAQSNLSIFTLIDCIWDLSKLLWSVQISDLTCVKNIIDVFQEWLIHYLVICQDKRLRFTIAPCQQHMLLNCISEVLTFEGLWELKLEVFLFKDKSRKLSQWLFSGAGDADQHRVTFWLVQHPHDRT